MCNTRSLFMMLCMPGFFSALPRITFLTLSQSLFKVVVITVNMSSVS